MEEVENKSPMSSLSLDVTVPCEPRYLQTLQQLAQRAVEYIGYHHSQQEDVVRNILHTVHGLFETDERVYTEVELRMATTDDEMRIRVRYLGAPSGAEGPSPIEQLLSRPDGDGIPIERLRRGMKTVALGRESGSDGADFCELTRALPEDP